MIMFSVENQNNRAVVYKFSVQKSHLWGFKHSQHSQIKKIVQIVTSVLKNKQTSQVVMCHIKGRSSGLETFRAPFCQTCSSRTGWINRSSFCFSWEPHTGSGLDQVHDSWSQHTPILRCCWTASPPPPPSARTDRPQTLVQWQLVPVPNTGAPP